MMPSPSDFQLPSAFQLERYDLAKARALVFAKRKARTVAIATVAVFILAIWGYGLLALKWPLNSLGTIPALFLVWIILGGSVYSLGEKYFTPDAFKGENNEIVSSYRKAVLHWRERELETGLLYWREKRGVDFEVALKKMLEKRGLTVSMTKGSGDGGIDLIVTGMSAGVTLWCQCKGYAKPVGVSPIRELAGVCSRGTAKPAFFVVNGYTKSARSTATELGVQLFDAFDIATLARNLPEKNGGVGANNKRSQRSAFSVRPRRMDRPTDSR